MPAVDFAALTRAFPEPLLLVRNDGEILAANAAARRKLALAAGERPGHLLELAATAPDAVLAYLRRCTGSGEAVPGTFELRERSGEWRRFRCDGAVVEPSGGDTTAATVVLFCRDAELAHGGFAALTQKIRDLDEEVRHRAIVQAELERALAEKDVLLREVNHRVKNNFSVVCSLLSLRAHGRADAGLQRIVSDVIERIRAMSLVHEMLYQREEGLVDVGDYLRALTDELASAYVPDDRVAIHVEGEGRLSLTVAVPLGLITTELATNALKHAFPGERTGRVTLRFCISGGECVFEFSDDGIGLPACPVGSDRPGAGLHLLHALAQQIGGTAKVDSDNTGTRIRVSFPCGEVQAV